MDRIPRFILSAYFLQLLVLCGLTPLQSLAQSSHTYYVSPKGNDNGSGSLKKPFKTIGRAQQEVRKVNRSGDVTVFLREGTYPITATIQFSAADGGTDRYKVSYKAYGNEKPILSGGRRITGWTADKKGIYKASVKGLAFRQLYVNDQRAIRARQPDAGDHYRLKGWDLKGRNLIMDAAYVNNWQHPEQVETIIQMYWSESIVHVKSVKKSSGGDNLAYVAIRDREADVLFPRPYPPKQDDAVLHFENAYEFVNQPGEWYLDNAAGELYYLPESTSVIQQLEIIAPVTETLLNVAGTLDNPVQNLVFEGLTFAHSNWDLPSREGYINAQAGMYNLSADTANNQFVRRPISAIRLVNATQVIFEKNYLQNLGATAIDLESGTKGCRITGNLIRNVAGNGVMVGAITGEKDGEYHQPYNPTDKREICTSDLITNNTITKTGRDYYGTCAITAGYPAGLTIEHNLIRDAPYTGISVGLGWTSKENAMRDNRVAFNDISNVMNVLCDGAAIYTLSLQPGTQIIGNYIHDITRSKWASSWPVAGIYMDEGSGGNDEKPLLLERNSVVVSDPTVRHLTLHKEGVLLLKHNSVYRIEDVIKQAGIQEPYRTLLVE